MPALDQVVHKSKDDHHPVHQACPVHVRRVWSRHRREEQEDVGDDQEADGDDVGDVSELSKVELRGREGITTDSLGQDGADDSQVGGEESSG